MKKLLQEPISLASQASMARKLGCEARMAKMTSEQKRELAQKGALARWGNKCKLPALPKMQPDMAKVMAFLRFKGMA